MLHYCLMNKLRARLIRHRQPQPAPAPKDLPVPASEIRTRDVEPEMRTVDRHDAITAVPYMAVIVGADTATTDRYEARNDALWLIARRRDLPDGDVAALVSWLASTNDVLRVERLAALKNDVMNLLRNQEPPPEI